MAKFEINGKVDILYKGFTFKSSIQNIVGKFIMIGVPIFEGHYLHFSKGDRIDISYYTERSILKFRAKVLGGGDERIPVLVIERPDRVVRIQRRNHVRASHIIDIRFAVIGGTPKIEKVGDTQEQGIDFFDAYTLDISAGGLRIVTKKRLNPDDELILILPINDETLTVHGRTVRVDKDEYKRYICGICFEQMDIKTTEKIVKYIFKVLREQCAKASKGD